MKKIIIALISIFVFGLTQCISFAQDQDIYFIAYINRLENRVKANWVIPHGKIDKKAVILLDIDKTGKLLSANVVNFSGDKEFDKTAMEAIIQSAPFEGFPQTITDEKATIKITFDQSSLEAAAASEVTISNNNISDANIYPVSDQKTAVISQNNINFTISNDSTTEKTGFGSYMDNLQSNIKSNWFPGRVKHPQQTVVHLKIDKSGNLMKVNILQSSGNKKFDKAALGAVYETAPFSSLPSEFQENFIDIKLTFNYNLVQQCYNNQPVMMPYHYQIKPYYYYYHRPNYYYQSCRSHYYNNNYRPYYNHYSPSYYGYNRPYYNHYRPYYSYYRPYHTPVVNNNYYAMPSDFSSPVTKFWAAERLIWLSFLIAHVCAHGI